MCLKIHVLCIIVSGLYTSGHVFVGLKDALFEPSSPFRHMCELLQIINSDPSAFSKPILFVYSDGGPDHRLTYFCAAFSYLSLSQIGFGLSMCLQNCPLSQLEEPCGKGYVGAKPRAAECWAGKS